MIVIAKSHDIYCGGPYPESGIDYMSWNLDLGKPLNLWSFIKNSTYDKQEAATFAGGTGSTPDELNKIIVRKAMKQWMKDYPAKPTAEDVSNKDSCMDVIQGNSSYQVRLGPMGFIFSPRLSHAEQACGVDVEIGHSSLIPFLNPEGVTFLREVHPG